MFSVFFLSFFVSKNSTGSFFILSLCKKILIYGQDLDLDKLSSLVNRELEEKDIQDESGNFVDMITPLQKTSSKCLFLSVAENNYKYGEGLVKEWEAQEEAFSNTKPQNLVSQPHSDDMVHELKKKLLSNLPSAKS